MQYNRLRLDFAKECFFFMINFIFILLLKEINKYYPLCRRQNTFNRFKRKTDSYTHAMNAMLFCCIKSKKCMYLTLCSAAKHYLSSKKKRKTKTK